MFAFSNIRRFFGFIIVALTLVTLLAACGEKATPNNNPAASSTMPKGESSKPQECDYVELTTGMVLEGQRNPNFYFEVGEISITPTWIRTAISEQFVTLEEKSRMMSGRIAPKGKQNPDGTWTTSPASSVLLPVKIENSHLMVPDFQDKNCREMKTRDFYPIESYPSANDSLLEMSFVVGYNGKSNLSKNETLVKPEVPSCFKSLPENRDKVNLISNDGNNFGTISVDKGRDIYVYDSKGKSYLLASNLKGFTKQQDKYVLRVFDYNGYPLFFIGNGDVGYSIPSLTCTPSILQNLANKITFVSGYTPNFNNFIYWN